MLKQNALKLERTDPVVGGLKDVIGTADEGQTALVVGEHHVAAAIEIAVRTIQFATLTLIALHQPRGPVSP